MPKTNLRLYLKTQHYKYNACLDFTPSSSSLNDYTFLRTVMQTYCSALYIPIGRPQSLYFGIAEEILLFQQINRYLSAEVLV